MENLVGLLNVESPGYLKSQIDAKPQAARYVLDQIEPLERQNLYSIKKLKKKGGPRVLSAAKKPEESQEPSFRL